jgi:hypothetical protein
LWPECLGRGTIATMDDEEVHPFWLNRDKDGYIEYCMENLQTARGISVTKPVASRWYNLLDILLETNGDLWFHREKDKLWWTESINAKPTSSLEPDHKPLRKGANVYVYHKKCSGWSSQDKNGRDLLWDGLHAKAKDFLFTEGTFQSLSENNAGYAHALINGTDLGEWHSQPDWLEKQGNAKKSPVKSFTPKERTALRILMTTKDTVRSSNSQEAIRKIKDKELRFSDDELKQYIVDLFDGQEGLCALTGLPMQLDGVDDDKQMQCSLDRIDSDGHYEAGNLQLVCRFANFWKSDQRNTEFLRLVELVKGVKVEL